MLFESWKFLLGIGGKCKKRFYEGLVGRIKYYHSIVTLPNEVLVGSSQRSR